MKKMLLVLFVLTSIKGFAASGILDSIRDDKVPAPFSFFNIPTIKVQTSVHSLSRDEALSECKSKLDQTALRLKSKKMTIFSVTPCKVEGSYVRGHIYFIK